MSTSTLELNTVSIAIQALSGHRRRQRVDATDTIVTENTEIRLLNHFSHAALVVLVKIRNEPAIRLPTLF